MRRRSLNGAGVRWCRKNIMWQAGRFYNKRDGWYVLIVEKRAWKKNTFTAHAPQRCAGKTDTVIYLVHFSEQVSENPVSLQYCPNLRFNFLSNLYSSCFEIARFSMQIIFLLNIKVESAYSYDIWINMHIYTQKNLDYIEMMNTWMYNVSPLY